MTAFEEGSGGRPRRPAGTAARLLDTIARTSPDLIPRIAEQLGAEPRQLEECRSEERALSLPSQMQLAACVASLAPQHARSAHRLYAQAQAALRMESSSEDRHLTYPRERFR